MFDAGYKNNTCGEDRNQRCRLCGTCRTGYKRHGDSTKCKLCPESGTNRALLVVGFVVMVVGSTVLIYMTIKDQGEEEEQEYAYEEDNSLEQKKKETPKKLSRTLSGVEKKS